MKKRHKLSAFVLAAVAAVCVSLVGCADKKKGGKKDPLPEPPVVECTHESVSPSVRRAPTCTDDGLTLYVCDNCHETVNEEVTPAKGHDYTQAETTGLCKTCEVKICSPGMTYELNGDKSGYIISDPEHNGGTDVVIPELHDGKPVVEIKSDAFNARAYIKSISVPKTVKAIGVGAFNGCNGLENIYYNAECAEDFRGINWVFYYSGTAPHLSVTIGKAVKRIPARLFYPHNADSDVIPYIESLTFEEGGKVESIGDYAFYKTNLTAVSLPDSIKEVGAHAFESSAVATVSFGAGLKTLGEHAFDYCVYLKSVDFSDSALESVGGSAFRNCAALATVTLAGTTKSVGDKAFYNCAALTDVALGGVEEIGESAFMSCSALKAVTLPATLVSIGKSAFEGCSSVSKITVEAERMAALPASNRAFYGVGSSVADGITVEISSTVKAIPERLFYSTADSGNNVCISRLDIAVGVESIGFGAFRGTTVKSATYAGTSAAYGAVDIADGNDAIGTPTFGSEVA